MPSVPAGSLVLVSGARCADLPVLKSEIWPILMLFRSGFIAVHVVQHLLHAGYKVRGTVRSSDKGDYLKKKFAKNFDYV